MTERTGEPTPARRNWHAQVLEQVLGDGDGIRFARRVTASLDEVISLEIGERLWEELGQPTRIHVEIDV